MFQNRALGDILHHKRTQKNYTNTLVDTFVLCVVSIRYIDLSMTRMTPWIDADNSAQRDVL